MATAAVLDVLFRGDASGLEKSFSGVDAAVTSVGKKAQAAGDQVKQAFSSFGGDKIASEAAAAAKGVAEIGGASKLTEKELAGVAATVAEAVAKFEALGKEVPADIAALSQEIANLGKTVDETGGRFDKLSGGLHNIGTASLGAAGVAVGAIAGIGAGLTAVGLDAAGQAIQGVKDLQAELGITEEHAKALGDVGAQVFKDNWGESIGEATKAVGLFDKAFDFELPAKTLKEITEQAFALQGAFEIDTADSATAVGILSTAFGDVAADGTKALDQIMTVMQNTGGNSDDLLETIGEYSPLFKQLGFDSEQFFGVLQSGLQAGARDTDYVADAIKEFGIRITDNSKSTNEALSNLGLDGLGEQVRTGMVTGADAFQMIQDKLAELPPDMRAAEGAVALFGTKFEDLGPEIFAALSTKPLEDFEGAAMDAGNVASTSLGAMWETIKRNATVALGDAFTPLVEKAQAMGPDIMAAILPAIEEIGGKIGAALGSIDLDALVSKLPGIMDTIGGLVESLISTLSGMDWEAIGAKVMSVGESIMGVFKWIAENPAIAKIAAIIGVVVSAFGSLLVIIGPIIPVVTGVVGAISGMVTAAGGLSVVLGTVAAALTGPLAIAIGIAVGLFLLWRAKGDEIKAALIAAFEAINEKFNEMGAALNAAWEGIKSAFQAAADFIVSKSDLIKAILLTIVTGGLILVYAAWVRYGDEIKAKAAEIGEWVAEKWDELKEATLAAWNAMKAAALAKWNEIKAGISAAVDATKAKVFEVLDAVKAAWDAAWGGLASVAETAWNNMVATITTVFGIIKGLVDTGVSAVVETFAFGWQVVQVTIDTAWALIKASVQTGIDFVKGIVTAGIQLLQGDWRGAWETIKTTVNTAIERVKVIVGALGSFLSGLKDTVLSKAKEIGASIGDGIRTALEGAWDLVLDKLTGLVNLLPQTVRDLLGIASPSKVFAQIGEWITLGLASGIQKADQKAVAALADVIGKMVSVSNGLADFGKKIAEMIVPSDQQIAAAKEKYLRMTMILTDFIKSISYLGALLPVANVSKAEPGQVRAINAGLTQLSQSFPAIKELQGMTADKLLTGGEASWASQLADTVGKISGVWGGIADSMTKIATAKFPTDDQLKSIKESTLRIATWAMGVLDQNMISSLGAEEFAKAIKGVVDALATVAGLALDKIAAVTDAQLQVAGASLTSLATWAREMMVDWLAIMPDAKTRAEFVGQLQEFATMIKAAADIVKSADIGDLSKMVVLQVSDFGPVKDALGRMQQLTTEIVQAWAKGAGDAAARAQWITDLKDFAATMSAAADILKIAAIGEIKAALEYNADALTDVLTRLRDHLQPAMAAIVAGWTLTNEQAALATERMKAFSDWIGAALSLAKLADVGKLVGEIEVDVIEIRAVLKWVRDNLAPEMAMVADAWKMASEEAERQTARMKEFGDWIGASIGLAKLADIGTLNGEVEADVIELRAVLKWVRDKLAPELVLVADAWSVASKEAERQTGRMKEFSDWISASIGMAKLANVGTLVGEIEADVIELRAVLNWVKDKLAPEMVAIAEAWGHTAESSKPIIEKMQAFGAFVAAAVGLAKSADLSELTSVTGVSGLAGKLEIVKTNILAMYGMLGEIAKDISVEEANARAALATALGSIGGGLADFGGGIGGIMELVQSKLFGSDASRGGLGHTQRTKTNRADFFATQLTDTVKRAVQAVQDALAGISIQPNDPKVTAIGQLGEAFGKLADGLSKLAEAKLPDAGQLAAIMAATGGASLALAGAAGGGGGAGPTVTGMGGGDMYIQYGNNVIVTDADDQAGLIEALKASIR